MWLLTNARKDKFKHELVNFDNVVNVYLDRGQGKFQLWAQTRLGTSILLAEEFDEAADHTLNCYTALQEALKEGSHYLDLSSL